MFIRNPKEITGRKKEMAKNTALFNAALNVITD